MKRLILASVTMVLLSSTANAQYQPGTVVSSPPAFTQPQVYSPYPAYNIPPYPVFNVRQNYYADAWGNRSYRLGAFDPTGGFPPMYNTMPFGIYQPSVPNIYIPR